MPLPDSIEIVPPAQPIHANVTVPGSKSITNRALILAALADGRTTMTGALWSEDTHVMVDCLHTLGFTVTVAPDANEFCNRTIVVDGLGGRIPRSGTSDAPLELFVGNAGTAARFLAAMVCLGQGAYRLHGVARMHERPQAALFMALRELGYRVDAPNDRLPAVIHGTGPLAKLAPCRVSVSQSSQFASALILSGGIGGWEIAELLGADDAAELPYVEMTVRLIEQFRKQSGRFQIEADSSSGSYFQGADWLLRQNRALAGSRVRVANWPDSMLQIDSEFGKFLRQFEKNGAPPGEELTLSRRDELGDSIMTAIVLAPFSARPMNFVHLGRLRVQESDRVLALHDELVKCGAHVDLAADNESLRVLPAATLRGAEIETYNDHRIAMCFAILAWIVPGIKIKNPACVKKTFPNFFQKLAAAPPAGLGVTILDGRSGRALRAAELFAD